MRRSRRSLLYFLPLFAIFFTSRFACAQMPNPQQGGAPGGYPGGPPSAPSKMPDTPAPPAAPERSRVVYITDFELEDGSAAADTGKTLTGSAPTAASSPNGKALAAQAQHIVKLMSDNLLKDFAKAGYTAKLVHPSDPRPDDGFLIAGVFTQVGTDNRLRRAVLGSAQDAETLQLYVAARDLAHFTPPLYQADPTDEAKTNAGAVIVVNPNADAVKFSITSDVTDKEVKQTAQRISAELVKRINAAVKSDDEQLNKYAKP